MEDIWNDESVEARSLNLAMLRQYQSGNMVSLDNLMSGIAEFPSSDRGGFDYRDFDADLWYRKTAGNFPLWVWLELKNSIVEKIFEKMQLQGNDYVCIEQYPDQIDRWFTLCIDKDIDFFRIKEELLKARQARNWNWNNNKTKRHETKLQDKGAPFAGDSEYTGTGVCCREDSIKPLIKYIGYEGSPFRC